MLNLFKLPFRGRKSHSDDYHSSPNLAVGVLKNFIRQRKNISGDDLDRACEIAAREMDMLQNRMQEPGADGYEMMAQYLRRIDENLDY